MPACIKRLSALDLSAKDGSWRWPLPPCSVQLGLALKKGEKLLSRVIDGKSTAADGPVNAVNSNHVGHGESDTRSARDKLAGLKPSVGWTLQPSCRVKMVKSFGLTSILGGIIGVRPSITLLPSPSLDLKRVFRFGPCGLTLRGRVLGANESSRPRYTVEFDWHPAEEVRIYTEAKGAGALNAHVEKDIPLGRNGALHLNGHFGLPAQIPYLAHASKAGSASAGPPAGGRVWTGQACAKDMKLELFSYGTSFRVDKSLKLPRSFYEVGDDGLVQGFLDSSEKAIAVVPGHWIDPWDEPGAPGEREFNMEVVNRITTQLSTGGWRVLRPDRDAPTMQWEDYLDWVSAQAARGIPTVEVHGQGSDADYRGIISGVIGNRSSPLNKELASDFGFFPMDWRDLAVPRRGGTVLESFNSDAVLRMSRGQRAAAATRLARRISRAILRSSKKGEANALRRRYNTSPKPASTAA
eukprot:jgi/Mesvir1/18426/Mv14293-RA.1